MNSALGRDALAGAIAGLVAGLVLGWIVQAQGMPGTPALLVLVSIPAGAAFGAILRYRARGYASAISGGLLFGLLGWVVGPLTLLPLSCWAGGRPGRWVKRAAPSRA